MSIGYRWRPETLNKDKLNDIGQEIRAHNKETEKKKSPCSMQHGPDTAVATPVDMQPVDIQYDEPMYGVDDAGGVMAALVEA